MGAQMIRASAAAAAAAAAASGARQAAAAAATTKAAAAAAAAPAAPAFALWGGRRCLVTAAAAEMRSQTSISIRPLAAAECSAKAEAVAAARKAFLTNRTGSSSSSSEVYMVCVADNPVKTSEGSELLLPSRAAALAVATEALRIHQLQQQQLLLLLQQQKQQQQQQVVRQQLPVYLLRRPLTGLLAFAQDIVQQQQQQQQAVQQQLIGELLQFIETDTALCREASPSPESLLQQETAAAAATAAAGDTTDLLQQRCGSWELRAAVLLQEQLLLPSVVASVSRRRGVSFRCSEGIATARQTPQTMLRLQEALSRLSPLQLVALQAAAGQLRSVLIADELLFGSAFDQQQQQQQQQQHQERRAHMCVGAQGAPGAPTAAAAAAAAEETAAAAAAAAQRAWEASSIESRMQQQHCGFVAGVHDVAEAEARLWLLAARTAVSLF
ncbi:hypothetical protein Esti_006123 [Eimeria stiedai]